MKILFLISLVAARLFGQSLPVPYPKLECGVYTASGSLKKRPNSLYVLQLRKETTSPIELLVLGGSAEQMFVRNRTRVAIRFSVPKPINDASYPAIIFDSFVSVDHPEKDFIRLVAKNACGKYR